MKPHEMRALAAQKKSEAERLLKTMSDDEGQLTPDNEARYDALLKDAEELVTKAAAGEAREKRLNDLAARFDDASPPTPSERRRAEGGPPLPHNDPRNVGTRHQYSMLKALRDMADPGKRRLDGLEAEVNAELAKRTGKAPRGIYVPWDLEVNTRAAQHFATQANVERRDLTLSTGAGAVMTVTSPTMIELLRALPLMTRLGARILSDMQGNFAIPRVNGGATAYWVTEGNAPTESSQTIGQVLFSPSTLGAFTDYSRQFLKQTSVDAEMFVRSDLATVLAIEIDRVGFNGSGSGAEPEGIRVNSSVNLVSLGANGAAPTWAAVVQMETEVANDNALLGAVSFVTTPAGRGKMKQVTKVASSTFSDFLWGGINQDNTVNGYPAYATNQLPSNLTKGSGSSLSAAILGNFQDAVYAFWGGLDILVDPYTGGSAGNVRIVELQDADFQLRHPESFAKIVDMVTT